MAQVLATIMPTDDPLTGETTTSVALPAHEASSTNNGLTDSGDGPTLSCLNAGSNDAEGSDVGATRRRGAHVRQEPKTDKVVVRVATKLRKTTEEDEKKGKLPIYTMTAVKRGYCVIINNLDFEGNPKLYRHGSKEEGAMLESLFTQLGFEVDQIFDAPRNKMKNTFLEYSMKPDQSECDGFIGIILSHGDKDNVVRGSDNHSIEVEHLIDYFNNKNCPALINKPKLFFIQACRGMKEDHGVHVEFVADGHSFAEVAGDIRDKIQITLPTWGDTLICYSTVDGYQSNRNEGYGSWFGDALVKVFEEDSWNLELYQMLIKVNNMLMNKEGSTKLKQSLEIVYRGWAKRLYFNPGLSEI